MRNIAIIALLLACVSVAGNAGNRKEFDLMKQENMKMKDKAEIYLAGCWHNRLPFVPHL